MNKIKLFIKQSFYAVSANLLNLLVSVITTLVVPKFLGNDIEQYGYLQIYLFYITYLGLFHFGWCDGIFLRDGGKEYKDLNKTLYSTQFWLFSILELVITIIIIIIGSQYADNLDYLFVFVAVALNVIVFLPRTMLQYFLQTTNKIKEYASITIFGRLIYGISIILILFFFSKNYKWFVIGDIIGKTFALALSIYLCRDIVFTKPKNIKIGVKEAKTNIFVGIKLTFANIASMLITGIVRLGIQQRWDVATYGKISLTLNVSSLILTFISAVAIVLYPTLRRIQKDKLIQMYGIIRSLLITVLLAMMALYCPLEIVLANWLPQYEDSLRYMAILFPMCIYSAKMTMLVQTYMNVYRLEKYILKTNICGVFVAIITTLVSINVINSLTCTMISIVINQIFRCVYAEWTLSRYININIFQDTIMEIVLTILFIVSSWYIGGWSGILIYAIGYFAYLYVKKNDLIYIIRYIKQISERI